MSFRGNASRNLPFGLQYQDISQHNTEKPQILLPVNGESTKIEKIIASSFISFQTIVKDGPFYTGSKLDGVGIKQKEEIEGYNDGINDGLKRYSDKYLKKRKIGPSINDHPYHIEFFPQELYKVMGVDEKKRKKLLNLSSLKNSKDYLNVLENGGNDTELSALEKLKNMADEEIESLDNKEEPVPEFEDNDDEFDEDDDDDYNAEKYFDDGEDFGDVDDYDDEAAF